MKILSCVLALVASANAFAKTETPAKITFAVERTSGFKPVQPALESYLAQHAATKGSHEICVIGYVEKSATATSKVAWVHWREGNRIALWKAAAKGFESKDTLVRSRRDLDLTKDVVATSDEVAGSTYLVSRDWANAIESDCKKRGKTYSIQVR